jgi:hypothetical protein
MSLSQQQQIEDIVMKHKLREFESSDTSLLCNSLSLITGLNPCLLPADLPRIKYEQVEKYWQKTYGKNKLKTKRSEDLLKSTDLVANPPLVGMSVELAGTASLLKADRERNRTSS